MTDTTKDINKRTSASIETKIELKRTQEAEIYKTTVTNKKNKHSKNKQNNNQKDSLVNSSNSLESSTVSPKNERIKTIQKEKKFIQIARLETLYCLKDSIRMVNNNSVICYKSKI